MSDPRAAWARGPYFMLIALVIALAVGYVLSITLPPRLQDLTTLGALAFWIGAGIFHAWVNRADRRRASVFTAGGILLLGVIAWLMWPLTEPG